MMNFFKKYQLATQILIRVFSIYLFVAILVTLLHMFWQYHDTKSFVAKELADTYSMVAPGLTMALWDYDDEQITKTLKGLELLPFISSVTLLDANGKIYTSLGVSEIYPHSKLDKKKTLNIYTANLIKNDTQNNQNINLGALTLYGDNSNLFNRLELGFWLLIINALIKTLAIWFIFMTVGYFMISKPLSILIKATKTLNLDSSEALIIDIPMAKNNEFKILESTFNEMSSRLYHTKNQLEYKGNYDSLTGLPNRQLFLDRLSQSIKIAQRNGNMLAVLFIDLDRFKEINDSLGHKVGDEVLKEVGHRLSQQIRKSDTLARLGGDEFTAIINSIEDKNVVVDIVKKMISIMNNVMLINKQPLYSTLSIGVTLYPDDADTADVLLKQADTAMYKAKDEGRNTYQYYTKEMTTKAFEHILMESNLRNALNKHEFVVYYQPQVFADNGYIFGMEALVRWQHPELGMVSPAKFIPTAEETGLIIPLGEEIFDIATKQIAKWMSNSSRTYCVSINLSVKQLQQKNLIAVLVNILEKNKCKPEWIELEVTEGYVMKDPGLAIRTLQNFRDLGIKIAIDDFGTGYSSLSYLKRLPINKLKIDQSFVRDISVDEDDRAIVESIIYLAKAMKLDVIAEGVETKEQQYFLQKQGCKEIQGYLYSQPVPAIEMGKLLEAKVISV